MFDYVCIDESSSVTRCDKICDYIRSETIHREVEYCENIISASSTMYIVQSPEC